MQITVLKSKLHRVTVTQSELDYVGSVTIDQDLLDACGIYEYEQVHIVNINNGARFETYAIGGERGSGIICLNGAAARCAQVKDKLIIMSYALMEPAELESNPPHVVFVDNSNRVVRVAPYERHGLPEGVPIE